VTVSKAIDAAAALGGARGARHCDGLTSSNFQSSGQGVAAQELVTRRSGEVLVLGGVL
jgi:hypothetical protein